MNKTRAFLLAAALVLVAACGTKGPLVMPTADAGKAGSSEPTGGTSRALPDEEGDAGNSVEANADGETPDPAADDE